MDPKYIPAIIYSVVLHGLLGLVLVLGDFTSHPKPTPTPIATVDPIQAITVDKAKLEKQVNKIKKQRADEKAREEKRIRDLEKRASAAKKKRSKEEDRIKKLESQRKKKEQEKIKADNKAKRAKAKAAEAEKLVKQKEAEKQKAEKAAAEAKARRKKAEADAKKSEELRKKKEADRKRKEKEARERAEQERMLAEQMAQEMAQRQQARRQQMTSEIGRYTALITQTIQRNLITDRSTMEGKSCKLTITLAPSGFVTNVQTGQGAAVVCNAAKNAVLKAGTLPVSKDPEVFKEMRSISLTVVPEF